MSDWDILAPTEGQNNENQDNDNDDNENDGMFLAENDDNDLFIGDHSASNKFGDNFQRAAYIESQSFNPRLHNGALKQNDIFHYHPDSDDDVNEGNQQANPVSYKDMTHSYVERRIHDADFGAIKRRYHNKKYKRRNMHRRRHDASDTDFAIAAVTHELLESGFDQKRYKIFHDAALHQRSKLGIGKAPEMNSLFYFWCYYLREHFDANMFTEFHELARQDAAAHSHYGIECFFRFCSYGLEKRWDPNVFGIFQTESLEDYKRGSLYGLEKVKGFLVHQKYDFDINQYLTPETSEVLEQFPTLESFKERRKDTFNKGRRPSRSHESKVLIDQDHRNQQQQQQQKPPKKTVVVEKRSIPQPLILPTPSNADRPRQNPPPADPKPKVEVTLPTEKDHAKIVFVHSNNDKTQEDKK